jgi:hypothetical protein
MQTDYHLPRQARDKGKVETDAFLSPAGGSGGGEGEIAPAEGRLYVIDLAGSERAADSKGHTKARMDETKQVRQQNLFTHL